MSRDALIVGINKYQHLSSLQAPVTDAEAIGQCLEQAGEFRIRRLPEQIYSSAQGNKPVVSDTQVLSQVQLKQALRQLFLPSSQQAPETALFYFSGHGIPDEEGYDQGYLATSDTDPQNPSSALSLGWLQWLLSKSTVKQQIIWLDCCHSGSLIVNVGAANPGNGESRDRCFIASSRDFESSWEDLNSPYSVLTKALLDGLDPTRLPGRWIDTFSLVDHVNQALKGELQTPVCTNFGEAINLTRTWQIETPSTETSRRDRSHCPYKGLEFFDCNSEDPKYFFGRDRLVGQLLDQVRTSNFMALVGASGSGKSSVLRAGLLHQLKLGQRITGSDQWQILITRPDANPMKNLAAAFVPKGGSQLDRAEALGKATRLLKEGATGLQRLVQTSTESRVLLVIDQFEEVFTRCDSIEEREEFFKCLMGALKENNLCLILAIRADFVGKCLEQDYSGLAKRLPAKTITVLPLTRDELRNAICKPAEQTSLTVEPALVTEILNDIQEAPGSLPLVQYTLKELWQRRQGNQLRLSAYQALGGINGTLDQRATEIYNSFDDAQQRTVQHIFQQLTQLGEGTEDTRRRVFLDNLIAEPLHPAERVEKVIGTLSDKDNRLLVASEVVGKGTISQRRAIVDVAHEALIRHWRLLRSWIEQSRDLLRQQRHIEASAATWYERNQSKGYLLRGLPLIEAVQFQQNQGNTFPLSDPAKHFIQKSVKRRRRSRSWLIIPAILAVGLIDHSRHEMNVRADFKALTSANSVAVKQAAEALVASCYSPKQYRKRIPQYFSERLFGNCRSLHRQPLSEANLSGARLSGAVLYGANLSRANLSNANLSQASLYGTIFFGANLSNTNLLQAKLSGARLDGARLDGANLSGAEIKGTRLSRVRFDGANLNGANLDDANLNGAIFLSTDLRFVNHLTQQQLEGDNSPLICNSPLPDGIEIPGGKDRDCEQLASILYKHGQTDFSSLEETEQYVKEQRQKSWD